MKHLLSLLAISLMVSPAFADTVVEIKSVELKATKANGKAWDVKIPMRKGSELPDIVIEVVSNSKTVFKTDKQKDTLKATYSGQKFSVPNGSNAIIKVWDMDAMGHDSAAEIPYVFSGNQAQIDLNNGQVKSLVIAITPDTKPAAGPAPAPKAEAAPAPKAEAAPAPKAE
ncbi:MAG: hypothetical protein CMH49_04165, partial [Myxococcales bacterium]|nr:hypothetical protein [Myxococcales bacterium]